MKKQIGMLFLMGLMIQPMAFSKGKAYCAKRCFNICKSTNQAVSGCDLTNVTSTSFNVKCNCRALKSGEKLPDSAPNYLINTRSFSH
jgi:hypothetical protein